MKSIYIDKVKEFLDSDTTKAKITKVALGAIVVAGSVGIVFIAVGMGNAVQIFSMFKKTKKYSKAQVKNAITNLHRQKYIEYISGKNGITTVRLTIKGESYLKNFAVDTIKIKKPKNWDGKWHLVMFDLPIKYSKARNSLRFQLKKLGFVQFQKSVWIYPYPCLDEILFIIDYHKIGKYVEILEVSNILNENKLKKLFNL